METSKTVVITGASQGIGRHIAIAFARQTTHHLVLLARNAENLAKTKTLCQESIAKISRNSQSSGSTETSELETGALKHSTSKHSDRQILSIPVDLVDPNAVQSISLPVEIPDPSLLILNAGHFLYKPLSTTSQVEFQQQIDANLFSAVHVVSRFLPFMKKRGEGLIVGIDSVSALKGNGESGAYSASKHALLGYLRSLRQELLPSGIGVSAIHLGQTFSPSWDGSQVNPEQLIDPNDVANILLSLTTLSSRTTIEEITVMPKRGEVPPM